MRFFKKNIIPLLIVVLSIITLIGCSGDQEVSKPDSPYFKNLTFYGDFPNDKTGRWRKAVFDTEIPAQEYAIDYYKEFFKSDDELHVIYNFQLNTVNVLRMYDSGTIDLSVRNYVSGEENDAQISGSGTTLEEHYINIETGEVTDFPYEEFIK